MVIIVILFAASLFIVNQKKDKQVALKNFTATVDQINDKINSSEAALIYKDEAKAQNLLNEAKLLLGSLPQASDDEKYQYQELSKKITERINDIFHIETANDKETIVATKDLFNLSSNIILIKNNLYLASGKEIYKIDVQAKTKTQIAALACPVAKITVFGSNQLLLYCPENKFFVLNVDNNTSTQLKFSLPKENSLIGDAAAYAKKLYVSDKANNQIYKYSSAASGFSSPTQWLQDEMDMNNLESLAVDGNIWLASNNGAIIKLFKGKKEIFQITGLNSELSDNAILYTNDSLNYLYILDKTTNLIVIADKQGKVIKNLIMNDAQKILSIVPSANESQLFILTADNIYRVAI